MRLLDLNLTELPTPVLISLKNAIKDELYERKRRAYVERGLRRPTSFKLRDYHFDESGTIILRENAAQLLDFTADCKRSHYREREKYLPCLLGQNWDFLFPTAQSTQRIYYVYAHLDPQKPLTRLGAFNTMLRGEPFYIGKGSNDRAWDLKRNQAHGKRIKELRNLGFPDSTFVHVIADKLTELQAFVLEAKLIHFFGSIYDKTIRGCLLNLVDYIKPQFVGTMKKLPARHHDNPEPFSPGNL